MQEDLEFQSVRTPRRGFTLRLKLAVGVAALVVASVATAPFAAASVSHSARATAAPAATTVLAPGFHARAGMPEPLWPHWGSPTDGTLLRVAPSTAWPHWGGGQFYGARAQSLWPHWGGPVR
ncbi:MAG: hypothetical protein ABSG36_06635 [Acidimicrobiales bacterium]|jgi:hypothetical protein